MPTLAALQPSQTPQRKANGQTRVPTAAAKVGHAHDVAEFRNLPLAGCPIQNPKVDATLGKLGPMPALYAKLDTLGPAAAGVSTFMRGLSRVAGPGLLLYCAIRNTLLLPKVWQDPLTTKSTKVIMTGYTGATWVESALAGFVALPAGIAARFGITQASQLLAARMCGLVAGIGGVVFMVTNLRETLHDKRSTPAAKLFAKTVFGLGMVGLAAAAGALVLSMPFAAGAAASVPGLLPLLTRGATGLFLASMVAWIGQRTLKDNKKLNSWLAPRKA